MSHTPGPWLMVVDPHAIVIDDATENTICEFTIDGEDDVAFYREVDSTVRPILAAEAIANARLFMAAPELLAALKLAVTECRCTLAQRDSGHMVECFVPAAHDAIAKAEGAQ